MSAQEPQTDILVEAPLKYTQFHIPPPAPFKNASSSYLKHDIQTIWTRNAQEILGTNNSLVKPQKGSETIVIHPGSRWIRIGRATDTFPISIPHVIARKVNPGCRSPPDIARVLKAPDSRPNRVRRGSDAMEEEADAGVGSEMMECVDTIRAALRSRMEFYKIPYDEAASGEAISFNRTAAIETIEEEKDVYRVDWVKGDSEDQVFIGHKVFRIADPAKSGYQIRWPFYGNHFNTRQYESLQAVLNDVQVMWETMIAQELRIDRKTFKDFSVVLMIPDYFDKHCVTHLVNMLLEHMKFRRVCIQQEGFGACLGSGLTTACVVDIGAVKTSVCCVEDGLLLTDTRMLLDYGGDDITELLQDILFQVGFPYTDIDLRRLYDLHVMDDLKARLCTLSEADVGIRLYDFFVRAPGRPTEKFLLKAYDETIVAPMCIFEPKIIDFESKKRVNPKRWNSELVDEGDLGSDNPTPAMVISTQHLLSNPEGAPAPSVDVKYEAGKLPLDVAIFNSVRAAGTDKIRKFLSTVIVVGGSALIPGAVHALESRLQAIAFPLVPNIERLTVVTSPPDIDPRVLAWKGITMITRLDILNDMWITEVEWKTFGMRCLRERSLIDKPGT